MLPDLIYCAGGNRLFRATAIATGFLYGARLPSTIYGPLAFADQDWKHPNRAAYMRALATYRPSMATVLDWERKEQWAEVLDWAEEAAQYVAEVLIVPKVVNGVDRIPSVIGGRPVRLAYAVGTRFGATSVPIWEFRGRPVHLLGGPPEKQMRAWSYLPHDVRSCDGNFIQKLARYWCVVWIPGRGPDGRKHRVQLRELEGRLRGPDAIYEAFGRSCCNVIAAWRALCATQ